MIIFQRCGPQVFEKNKTGKRAWEKIYVSKRQRKKNALRKGRSGACTPVEASIKFSKTEKDVKVVWSVSS